MKKHAGWDYIVGSAGLVVLAAGWILLKRFGGDPGFLGTLPYLCIGVGCGAFGHGMGGILSRAAVRKHPELQREIEIEQTDERNVAIANQAKAKAFDAMLFIFGALMLSFALMQVELAAILLLVFAYLLVAGLGVYYRCKLEKEM